MKFVASLGFWAGRQGVGGWGAALPGLIGRATLDAPAGFMLRSRVNAAATLLKTDNFAMFAAMRRASSRVIRCAARRPGSSSKET